jgi:hypothetical protein
MDKTSFWRNFKLGEELQISGRFIFNGLRSFHEMDSFYHHDEIFETLYNLSVGIERLVKVAILLVEHNASDQDSLEKSLITHDHQSLFARLKKNVPLNLGTVHNDFIAMLSTFYKSHRYDRFGLAAMSVDGKEKLALHGFIEKYLDIKVRDNFPLDITPNTDQIRRFLGRAVGKIASQVYEAIRTSASNLNIFTYEIRSDSKAGKIFLGKSFDFLPEETLWRELVVFIMNCRHERGLFGFIRGIEPLDFDPQLLSEYLEAFGSTEKMQRVVGELESLYDDIENKTTRLSQLEVLTNHHIDFDDEEDTFELPGDIEE